MSRLMPILIFVLLLGNSCSLKFITNITYKKGMANAPFDAIIVPGITYDTAHPSSLFKARIYWAKELFDEGIAKNIIFTGAAVGSAYREGKVMKIYADAVGIPPEHTFYETRARYSNENILYARKLAEQKGFDKIAIATDLYHSFLFGFVNPPFARGLSRLPIKMDKLKQYGKEKLPAVDVRSAYEKDFVPRHRSRNLLKRAHESFHEIAEVEKPLKNWDLVGKQ